MIFFFEPHPLCTGMMRKSARWAMLPLVLAFARDARGQETSAPPPSGAMNPTFEIGGVASYLTPPVHGGTTPFGFGFGGRAGLDLGDLYMGATVVQYLGGTDVDLSDRAILFGMELGYGTRFQAFGGAYITVRPVVGLGGAAISHTDPSLLAQSKADVVTSASGGGGGGVSDTVTVTYLYVQPGLVGMLSSGSHFVALDGSALVIPSVSYGGVSQPSTWLSYGLRLQLGFVF
jgi:hypothetical protein